MTVALPYEGAHPVTQRFGSNTAAYARFGMRGHNGIDFGLPTGTRLYSPAAGTVTERRNDPTGYGQYTVVTDDGGDQWLLAHGSSWVVREGQRVEAGQYLGKSGSTGNSTGPHLHLGYRPAGYDRSNGYLGYTNPRPLLPLPYRVLLQAGHSPDGGGAPGEAEWTLRLAEALAPRLVQAGVGVVTVGDFYNRPPPPAVEDDYDLCLSLHYDAAVYGHSTGNSGCCAARGEAETEWWEADRFLSHWLAAYPDATGIPLHQERVNPNMTRYYAWRHLTYVTPGVLLEHGVGAPGAGLDAPVLHDDLDRVAATDAATLLKYLSLPIPLESDMARILNDEELYEAANKAWGELRSVPCVKENGFYQSWVEALRAGDYKGLPLSGELGLTFGTCQLFDRGFAVWKQDQPVSWEG